MKKNESMVCDGISYVLIDKIGEGGKGEIWKAEADQCSYAIKFLKKNLSTKDKARFEQEINFCKNNRHINIVKFVVNGVYDSTQQQYYIMPFCAKTFRDIIQEINDPQAIIRYFLQLCDAEKFIHDKGIFHRDIKPENVLWDESKKRIYLADFGIAHLPDSPLTTSNERLANFNYQAPEQKKGSGFKITAATDIFALGLLLNECFTKQIISGVNYKKVKDLYPLYQDIDLLVENMITQIPENRFNINMVITQLNLIHSKTKEEIKYITEQLKEIAPKRHKHAVIKQAAADIAFAKRIFCDNEIKHLNPNWHCGNKICYDVSTWLSNLCVQEQILKSVKSKFYYESNGTLGNYRALNLSKPEDKKLYDEIQSILEKYKVSGRKYDLTGRILKYFCSCSDYHCKELLDGIKREESDNDYLRNIEQAPILWVVQFLKKELKESLFELQTDGDFDFSDNIEVNWKFTDDNYCDMDVVDDLADSIYYSGIIYAEENLQKLKEIIAKEKIVIQTKLENDFYMIYMSENQYSKLRSMLTKILQENSAALEDSYIEYDTEDLLCIYEKHKDIVVLKWSVSWDIKVTLKKLLEMLTVENHR